ncbi:MAG: hypothetical protein ABW032_01345 [Burkholderiaceae bacterium]
MRPKAREAEAGSPGFGFFFGRPRAVGQIDTDPLSDASAFLPEAAPCRRSMAGVTWWGSAATALPAPGDARRASTATGTPIAELTPLTAKVR